jgi:hypothetical protein
MSLRIVGKSKSNLESAGGEGIGDDYLTRLIKLVPTEAVTAYPLLKSKAEAAGEWALFVLAWAMLVVVVAIRWNATATSGKGPQWTAIAISVISFVIWIYATNGDLGFLALAKSKFESVAVAQGNAKDFLTSLAFVMWAVLAPLFYKGGRDG